MSSTFEVIPVSLRGQPEFAPVLVSDFDLSVDCKESLLAYDMAKSIIIVIMPRIMVYINTFGFICLDLGIGRLLTTPCL